MSSKEGRGEDGKESGGEKEGEQHNYFLPHIALPPYMMLPTEQD